MPDAIVQTNVTVHFDLDPILEDMLFRQIDHFEIMINSLRPKETAPFFAKHDFDYYMHYHDWHKLYFDANGRLDWRRCHITPSPVLREHAQYMRANAIDVEDL